MLVVALAYAATGQLGLALAIPPGYASAIWPASGIALAAVLICGPRVWPAILLGSFVTNVGNGFDERTLAVSLLVPSIIAAAAALQAVLGGALVRRFGGFPNRLGELGQVLKLLALGGVVATSVNATISILTLLLTDKVPPANAWANWVTWWGGDAMGVFVFTPLVLAWSPLLGWSRRRRAVPFTLCVGLCFVLTVAIVAHAASLERRDFRTRFDLYGENLAAQLARTGSSYLNAVSAIEGFFASPRQRAAEEFHIFASRLRARIPGIQVLEWVPRHETADGTPHYPITFAEPEQSSIIPLGKDLGADPVRLAALEQARDTGQAVLSEPLSLAQDGRLAVLVVVPVYGAGAGAWLDTVEHRRAALSGFGLAVVRPVDMLATALNGIDASGSEFWLMDETPGGAPHLLVSNSDSSPGRFALAERGLFGAAGWVGNAMPIELGGRRWVLHTAPTQVFVARHRSQSAWQVLLTGLLFTAMVGTFVMVLTGRADALSAMVDQRTAALRDSEEKFRALVESSADCIWEADAAGCYTYVSPRIEQLLGYRPEEMLGKLPSAFMTEAEAKRATPQFLRMLAERRPFLLLTARLHRDGREIMLETSGTPIFDDQDRVIGLRGVSRDVTARQRAERELNAARARMEAILNNSPMGMVLIGLDRTVQQVNPAFCRIFRLSPAECVGNSTRQLYFSDEQYEDVGRRAYAAVTDGRPFEDVLPMRQRDGGELWARLVGQPVDSARPELGVVWAVEDVTEARERQRSLTEAHHRLQSQAKELARSNAELEQFAYVASHDLRQPLRMVSSYVSLLERRLGNNLDEDSRQFIAYARDGAKRMDRLILDLLEYSRIGRLTQPFEAVNLNEVAAEAVLNLTVAAQETAASIHLPGSLPVIQGDRFELVRLMQNLIGNSLKYCHPDRRADIAVSCRRDGDVWLLSVKDNGIGIPEDQLERIFGVFQRLHASSEYEGTGIGLAVCRKIAEHHGGSICAHSQLGEGSEFVVALPAEG